MLNIALIDAANIITLNFPRRRKDRRDRDLLYTIGNSLNLPDFVYKSNYTKVKEFGNISQIL